MTRSNITAIITAYFAMTLIFTIMILAACMIPHRLIDDNIRRSLVTLQDEGRYPPTCGLLLWARDNITDATMYNIAVSGYDMTPEQEFADNPWSFSGNESDHTATFGLKAMDTRDGSVNRISYGRYWHGYQLPLRLTSIFLTIRGQRVLHSVVLWMLLLISSVMIARRLGVAVSLSWAATIVLTGFPVVPLSLQYVACYYVMFFAVIAMLIWPGLMKSPLTYFIIGGCTAFFDFLTVPLITLGLPLAIAVVADRSIGYRKLLWLIAAWGAGYCGLWATKWLLQYLITGADSLGSAVNAGSHHTIFNFLPEGIHYKYFNITAGLLSAALAATVAVAVTVRRRLPHDVTTGCLMIVAMVPFAWYILFLGHNTAHIWFTYRSLTTPALCCLLMMLSLRKKTASRL